MQDPSDISLAAKIEFLRHAEGYPDGPIAIDVIETHFAWVFLSRNFVYKLKKPIKFRDLDTVSLGARKLDCELEVRLNRRLARRTYLGVVPLSTGPSGLCLGDGGAVVDWLVKMRRLPAERGLMRAAQDRAASIRDLHRLVAKLARFYAATAPAPWAPTEYADALRERVRENGLELGAPELRLDAAAIDPVVSLQHRFIDRHRAWLEERMRQDRIVDAHGDLRPEHVFLVEDPQIIDCLEFNAELRLLDSAAEIVFLALECERLGERRLGETIMQLYLEAAHDPVRPELLGFYRSMAAVTRALSSAWHLPDSPSIDAVRWAQQATWYLDAARACIVDALK